MNASIQDFISGKRVALAGASRSGGKFGNIAARELRERGYEVFLIHPEAKTLDGQPCCPRLTSLIGKVDGVLVSLPPEQAGQVLQDAAAAGIHNVWLQPGAETLELLDLGRDLGLNIVSGKCILMYANPVRSFHWMHRAVAKLTGQF